MNVVTKPKNKTLAGIEEWLNTVHLRDAKFEKRFCPEAWFIEGVWWSASTMKVNYILEDGATITNTFPIKEWLKFYEENK